MSNRQIGPVAKALIAAKKRMGDLIEKIDLAIHDALRENAALRDIGTKFPAGEAAALVMLEDLKTWKWNDEDPDWRGHIDAWAKNRCLAQRKEG